MADSRGRRPISSTNSNARSDFPRRHYGRRKGRKLRARQAGLFDDLLPRLRVKLRPGVDPRKYFSPDAKEVWFEIGFGAGEHLYWQVEHNRPIGIIGAEPFISGIAKLLAKLARENDERLNGNIRLHEGDARDVIAALPDRSISRVFLLFPDPWPKARHHKRRFVQTEMLNQVARVMDVGAELRLATDDVGYLVWALEHLTAHGSFHWLAASPSDWQKQGSDWPETRYEAKAKKAGKTCTYLRFLRV